MCKRWVSSASCNALLLVALYRRAMLGTDLNTDNDEVEDADDDDATPRATRSMETQPT